MSVMVAVLVAVLVAGLAAVLLAPAGQARSVQASALAAGERPTARLVIPAIGVDAAMIPVGVDRRGQLAIGRSVRGVYRWRHGVFPGQHGSAVLAGHTWSRGDGVFDRLGSLRRGHRIAVGKARFRVTRVQRVRRLSAAQVRELFSDRGAPRLVLITCGDRDDRTGVYRTRILVRARKV